MRPPQPEGAPRLDVSIEELEALLEQARPALSEDGYEKLRAAIRTLGYVTELLAENPSTSTRSSGFTAFPNRGRRSRRFRRRAR